MRKFKHVETGNIATETHSEKNYKVSYPQNYTIPKWIIENSKDWVEIFEPKFKNGDVIVNQFGGIIFIQDVENGIGYGFNSNRQWFGIGTSFGCIIKNNRCRLATKEEWLEVLTKEADNRGLVSGATCLFGTGKDKRALNYSSYYKLKNNNVFALGNDVLMHDGIWAEVIKEETLEELAKKFQCYYNNNSVISSRDCYEAFFNENKETIHRLSK